MNEKIRKIIMCFGSVFVGILAFICGKFLYNKRDTTNTVGDNDRQSAKLAERVGREIEDLAGRSRESETDYTAAKQTITEIRNSQKVLENNSNNS